MINTEDSNNKYYKCIVRIISHTPVYDWVSPFRLEGMQTSSGTGFFIDGKGHILTCSHVVENATHVYIEIPMEGKKEHKAVVLGMCPYFDLALLRIENYKNTEFLELETDDSHVTPGDNTMALGFPLGQDNLKLTSGVVSGQQYGYFQIDTPINPGNSGGPLVKKNKVIGINGAGIPFANNIGYAVPISRYWLIKELLFQKENNLILYPEVFGFDYQRSSPDIQEFMCSNCREGGILIKSIFKKSPISKTKLKEGDILCSISGCQIDYYGELDRKWMGQKMDFKNLISTIKVGSKIPITFWDGVEMVNDEFILEHYDLPIRKYYPTHEKMDYEIVGGLVITPLTINIMEHLMMSQMFASNQSSSQTNGLSKYTKISNRVEPRIMISSVLKGSYVSSLKTISDGEVIEKVNGHRVKTIADFRKNILKTISNIRGTNNKQYVIITTENKRNIIMPVEKIIEEDKSLSDIYHYKSSDLLTKFKKTTVSAVTKKNSNKNKFTRKMAKQFIKKFF